MITVILAAIGLIFILAIFLTELEQFGWATLTLVATTVALQWTHTLDILGYVAHHGAESALYAVGYLVVGVVWSFIKWYSFLMRFRDRYREVRNGWLKDKNIQANEMLTEAQALALKEYLSRNYFYDRHSGCSFSERPRAAKNKRRIVAWMAFWPCSLVGTILNDPVKRFFKFVFERLKNLYQKIADHVFRNDQELR